MSIQNIVQSKHWELIVAVGIISSFGLSLLLLSLNLLGKLGEHFWGWDLWPFVVWILVLTVLTHGYGSPVQKSLQRVGVLGLLPASAYWLALILGILTLREKSVWLFLLTIICFYGLSYFSYHVLKNHAFPSKLVNKIWKHFPLREFLIRLGLLLLLVFLAGWLLGGFWGLIILFAGIHHLYVKMAQKVSSKFKQAIFLNFVSLGFTILSVFIWTIIFIFLGLIVFLQ